SNVDLDALFFAWLAIALATRPDARRIHLVWAGVAAAWAVCCKEQVAPVSAVAGLTAMARAWRGRAAEAGTPHRAGGARAALLVAGAAALASALVWMLPFNLSGWLEHHRFIFFTAKYPRTFAATAEGYRSLAQRCFEIAPVALGWPVLAGLGLA